VPQRRARAIACLLSTAALLAGACGDSTTDAQDSPTTVAAAPGTTDAAGSSAETTAPAGSETTQESTAAPTTQAPDTTAPDPSPAPAALTFPGDTWEAVDPGDAGFDAAGLDAFAEAAETAGSDCVVVTRNGQLVYEAYFGDRVAGDQSQTWSATKSVTAALVGIAEDQGLLSLDDLASEYIPEWVGTDSEAITVRNLISNDSGRYYDFQTDYVDMAGGAADKTQFSIDLEQQHEIGTEWVYNNSAIQTLEQVLEVATGESDVAAWADEVMLAPIGLEHTWLHDSVGNALTFMGVNADCLNMARFGHLLLADGAWDGEQIISADFVADLAQPSQDLSNEYGYLTWLNPLEDDAKPTPPDGDGPWPGSSADAFAAQGLGGQLVVVEPSTGVVWTRMSSTNTGDDARNVLSAALGEAFTGR
jgi:CubicO group peptidase (beta-lactamase class C family)